LASQGESACPWKKTLHELRQTISPNQMGREERCTFSSRNLQDGRRGRVKHASNLLQRKKENGKLELEGD